MNTRGRAASSTRSPRERPAAGLAKMYGHFRVADGTERFYDRICEHMNFPATISPGLLGHFAGPIEGGWEVVDIWREDDAMEQVFSEYLVDAVSAAIEKTGERVDVEPEMRGVARVVVGPAAGRHRVEQGAGRKCSERGVQPVGVTIDTPRGDAAGYLRGCEFLDFPAQMPDGLVVHLAGECESGWRVFDCWDSAEKCDEYMRRVERAIDFAKTGSGGVSVHRFDLTRAFVSPLLSGGGYLPE